MNTTSEHISNLHAVVRTLEDMRKKISAELMEPVGPATAGTSERAQLSDLHRRISKALAELSAEYRQM